MNGVINVYKECGVTSFYVVAQVRSIFNVKKAGHTGTLDPIAEGVLPICLGYATKFADIFTTGDKQYIAKFRLGSSYDTFDTTGSILQTSDIRPDEDSIRAVLEGFTGQRELTVPAFSAKKINGHRAYDLARKGELKDAGMASMKIYKIEFLSYCYPEGVFVIDCGKGTYVRSVIHEMGVKLGSYAAMSGLIRSRNGPFHMKDSYKISEIKRLTGEGMGAELIVPVQDILNIPRAVVKDAVVSSVLNGVSPQTADYQLLPDTGIGGLCLLTTVKGKVIALGNIQKGFPVPVKLSKVFQD